MIVSVPASPPAPASLRQSVDVLMRQRQKELHIPGMALVIVKDDRVVYAHAFGVRNVAKNQPVTLDTVFPIGSCTKAFTAMTLAIEQDRGLVSFHDHPQRYLTDFKMADPVANAGVTLVDMLSHRTGLMAYNDLSAEPGVLTMDQYVRAATSAKPTAPFRSKFQYNNAMVVAAGKIAGTVNGSTWAQAVTQDVLEPLGMDSTTPDVFAAMHDADHATGYTYDPSAGWQPVAPPATLRELAPAGAVASSANDMTRWVRMLADGGVVDGKRFVSAVSYEQMTTPTIKVSPRFSYGLGWAIYSLNGQKVVEHNGGSEGISALVSFIPSRHTGFVLLANTTHTAMTTVGNLATRLYPRLLNEPGSEAPSQAPSATPAPKPSRSSAALPPADALIARAIAALGGERAMQRHASISIEERKWYANQGVTASVTVLAGAPASQETRETWFAAGREIARLRLYFDGTRGGQATTFGQNAADDATERVAARRDDRLHPLLSLKHDYRRVRVVESTTFAGEPSYVIELAPAEGDSVFLTVSKSSGIPLERSEGNTTQTFADYRLVDGEVVPFRITIHDELGETDVRVDRIRFDVPIPPDAFSPRRTL